MNFFAFSVQMQMHKKMHNLLFSILQALIYICAQKETTMNKHLLLALLCACSSSHCSSQVSTVSLVDVKDHVPNHNHAVPSVSGVDVKLTSPAYEPLSVQLASSSADMPVVYGNIQKGVAECHLSVSNFAPGVYQVSVLSDGNVIAQMMLKREPLSHTLRITEKRIYWQQSIIAQDAYTRR